MDPPPQLAVHSSFVVADGCPISYHVDCRALANIRCVGPSGGVELWFQADALRTFLRVGADALRAVDERLSHYPVSSAGKVDGTSP